MVATLYVPFIFLLLCLIGIAFLVPAPTGTWDDKQKLKMAMAIDQTNVRGVITNALNAYAEHQGLSEQWQKNAVASVLLEYYNLHKKNPFERDFVLSHWPWLESYVNDTLDPPPSAYAPYQLPHE